MPAETKRRSRPVPAELADTQVAPPGSNTAVKAAPGPLPVDTPPARIPPPLEGEVPPPQTPSRVWTRYRHPRTEVVALDIVDPDGLEGGTVHISRLALEALLVEAGYERQATA